jgi:dihydrofolate reductase
MFVSLDGFVDGPNRDLDWHIVDEELHTFVNAQAREVGTFLYGRRMYDVMAYWETADQNPSGTWYELEFARIWKSTPKIVFSQTLETVQGNAKVARDVSSEEIAKLKDQPVKDIEVGGPTLAATFVRLGLIDEYRLYVHPVILGGGTPFFAPLANRIGL